MSSVSYSLDPVGNRLTDSSSLSGVSSVSSTFDSDDRLASESYDNDGNVTATGGNTFAYNSQNQLISMNSGAVTIVYDGDGNRVSKTVSGVTTHYLVDDLNPTGYPQVVEELSGTTLARVYSYGLQRISENQLVSSTWTPSFYGYDGMGNVRQLINSAGSVTDTYEYDAWGNKLNSTGTTPNVYLYRGEQYDSDLGLYYLRARYYNPVTGRFMSRDPEDGKANDPKTLHRYLYAAGDPINWLDPTGKTTVSKPQGGLGGAIAEWASIVQFVSLRAFIITQVTIPAYLVSNQGIRAAYVLVSASTLGIGIACEIIDIWKGLESISEFNHGEPQVRPNEDGCVDGVDSGAGDSGDQ